MITDRPAPSRVDSPQALRKLPESALPALCESLREEIIEICGRVGGHLGASLGAVELVVALHRVFESPKDRLIFDVGHQAYAHKLLTGRRERMHTLRQEGGIAPFCDPSESPHDAFGAGHACTAISVALGMLEARALRGAGGKVVAVCGDGALTGGLSFEGLANAGGSGHGHGLLVVLNDNEMSISPNVGAVARLLRGLEARAFFESLGFSYLGPLDGHDLPALIEAFHLARTADKPMVVHVRTRKGKGFPEAEADERTRGHAMGPYQWRGGKLVRSRAGRTTFSEAFAEALEAKMAADPRVVAVTPAMLEGSALMGLKGRFPERVFDVGIAEPHAVTFCAGLAAEGLRPVCLIYSTFLQRAYDSVIHDVCLPRLPVIFAIDRAGLVGADGATHQGAFDLAFLRPVPNLSLAAPVWGEDLGPLLDLALELGGPFALRFPRAAVPESPRPEAVPSPRFGRARWLKRAARPALTVIALGPLALEASAAAEGREDWSVLDAGFVSPLDREAVVEAASCGRLLVVEEGTTHGGLSSAVLEGVASLKAAPKVRWLGLPDRFVRHGEARAQRHALGLDVEGIRRAAESLSGDGGANH